MYIQQLHQNSVNQKHLKFQIVCVQNLEASQNFSKIRLLKPFKGFVSSLLNESILSNYFPWWKFHDINFWINKTSIQWNPGSQVYLSKKKKFFGQKRFLNKNKTKY